MKTDLTINLPEGFMLADGDQPRKPVVGDFLLCGTLCRLASELCTNNNILNNYYILRKIVPEKGQLCWVWDVSGEDIACNGETRYSERKLRFFTGLTAEQPNPGLSKVEKYPYAAARLPGTLSQWEEYRYIEAYQP